MTWRTPVDFRYINIFAFLPRSSTRRNFDFTAELQFFFFKDTQTHTHTNACTHNDTHFVSRSDPSF